MRNWNLTRFLYIILGFSALIWFISAKMSKIDLSGFWGFIRPIPNVVTADLLLIGIFTRWFWCWKCFQGWLVPFPDLNGTWQGHIQTNWKDEKGQTPGPIPVILTIKQTFGQISCVMRTAEMVSHSYTEGFSIDQQLQVKRLCYSYTSNPKVILRNRSTPHDGTIIFNLIGSPVNKLEGEYWTQRQTAGTVTLKLRTRKLLDEIPDDLAAHPMASKIHENNQSLDSDEASK